MINLKTRRQKIIYRNFLIRKMAVLEIKSAKKLRPALKSSVNEAIKLIEDGVLGLDALYKTVDASEDRLKKTLISTYKASDKVFVPLAARAVTKAPEEKDAEQGVVTSAFEIARTQFLSEMAAEKVVGVTDFTKDMIRGVLMHGLEENLSPLEIASNLRAKNSIFSSMRALRISRTETHMAAVSSQQQVVQFSGIETEKEWTSANDDYVRSVRRGDKFDHAVANGERTSVNEQYERTGELLRFPGDPSGSAGNVINCRCVELYHTV